MEDCRVTGFASWEPTMKTKCISWITLLVLSAALQPAHGQRLSKEQAVERARAFCEAIGVTVSASPEASFPALVGLRPGEEPHWQACWKVRFGRQADVRVVDSSGVVCSLINWDLNSRMSAATGAKPGGAISEAEAIARAVSVVTASGQSDELRFEDTLLIKSEKPG